MLNNIISFGPGLRSAVLCGGVMHGFCRPGRDAAFRPDATTRQSTGTKDHLGKALETLETRTRKCNKKREKETTLLPRMVRC